MGFVKGFAFGVSSVVLGVIGVATVCAIRDLRKEEKDEAEILQAAKDSYDREIGAVFEKIKKKFSA
ncbi:MAG: hypothetical protein PUJ82_13745 [Spirochaetales bacterium]|nr:hypothetical protein [Spirochaetales bacterium]MDY5916222.1 hypothetical protein [Treponema sp.]